MDSDCRGGHGISILSSRSFGSALVAFKPPQKGARDHRYVSFRRCSAPAVGMNELAAAAVRRPREERPDTLRTFPTLA